VFVFEKTMACSALSPPPSKTFYDNRPILKHYKEGKMSISLIPGIDPENVIGSPLFYMHVEASVKFINDKVAAAVYKNSIKEPKLVFDDFLPEKDVR